MMIAARLGMTSPGYVYITFTIRPTDWTLTPWLPRLSFNDPENVTAAELLRRKEIFQSLKQVTLLTFVIRMTHKMCYIYRLLVNT